MARGNIRYFNGYEQLTQRNEPMSQYMALTLIWCSSRWHNAVSATYSYFETMMPFRFPPWRLFCLSP